MVMQIIIAILLIGNYGLMDIFMLKGLISKLIPKNNDRRKGNRSNGGDM